MTAFDDLNYATGADKFTDFYAKYNATMDALKAGTLNLVLVATGVGSAPVYQAFWSAFTVVGSGGGAPAYASNFGASGGTGDTLRFRKSVISNSVEVVGRFKRTTTTLVAVDSAVVFILPSGYLPSRTVVGTIRLGTANNDSVTAIIDTSGNVTICNTTSSTIAINTFMDITLRFPIS